MFSQSAIDSTLVFLKNRRKNHGRDNNDIEVSEDGQAIKQIFIDNNIE